jgi:hypothetical protein
VKKCRLRLPGKSDANLKFAGAVLVTGRKHPPKPSPPPKTSPAPCAKHPQYLHSSCPKCNPRDSSTPPPPEAHCGVITHLFHDRNGQFCAFQVQPRDGSDGLCFRRVKPQAYDLVSNARKACYTVEVECREKGGEKEVIGLVLKKEE